MEWRPWLGLGEKRLHLSVPRSGKGRGDWVRLKENVLHIFFSTKKCRNMKTSVQIILKPFCPGQGKTLHCYLVNFLQTLLFSFVLSSPFLSTSFSSLLFLFFTQKCKSTFQSKPTVLKFRGWNAVWKSEVTLKNFDACNCGFSKTQRLVFHMSKCHHTAFSKFLLLITLFLCRPKLFAKFDLILQVFVKKFSRWSGCAGVRGQKTWAAATWAVWGRDGRAGMWMVVQGHSC